MSKSCYKSYTCKTLESVQKSDVSDNQTMQCGNESGKNVEPCRILLKYQFSLYVRAPEKINTKKAHPEKEHPGKRTRKRTP